MSRTRTTNTKQLNTVGYVDYPAVLRYNRQVYNTFSGGERTCIDEPHPGYLSRLRGGEVVLGNFHLGWYNREPTDSYMFFGTHPIWGAREINGDISSFIESHASHVDPVAANYPAMAGNAATYSLLKCYEQMNSSQLMTGEFLGSLDATVGMLRSPLQKSRALLQKVLKKRNKLSRLKKGRMLAQATGDAWLEGRYGWGPLIMDMQAIIDRANQQSQKRANRLVARSTLRLPLGTFKCSVAGAGIVPGTTWASAETTFKWEGSGSAGVIYDVFNQTSYEELSAFTGTRARDLGPTLWELTPYSFVVDWFLSVGAWLQAITPSPGVSVRGSWTTSLYKRTYKVNNGYAKIEITLPPAATYVSSFAGATYTNGAVDRIINPSIPNLPVLRPNKLSVLHSVDSCALLVGEINNLLTKLRH